MELIGPDMVHLDLIIFVDNSVRDLSIIIMRRLEELHKLTVNI